MVLYSSVFKDPCKMKDSGNEPFLSKGNGRSICSSGPPLSRILEFTWFLQSSRLIISWWKFQPQIHLLFSFLPAPSPSPGPQSGLLASHQIDYSLLTIKLASSASQNHSPILLPEGTHLWESVTHLRLVLKFCCTQGFVCTGLSFLWHRRHNSSALPDGRICLVLPCSLLAHSLQSGCLVARPGVLLLTWNCCKW